MKPQSRFQDLPVTARFAILLFAIIGSVALLYSAAYTATFVAPGRMVLLLGAAAVTARAKVSLYKSSTLSLLTAVVMMVVIQEGLAAAVLTAICGVAVQTLFPKRRVVVHQLAFNVSMIAATVVATWWVHHWVASAGSVGPLSSELTATLVAAFIYFLGNSVSVSLIIALSKGVSMLHIWLHHFLSSAPSFILAGLLSLAIIGITGSASFALIFSLVSITSLVYFCSVRIAAARVAS